MFDIRALADRLHLEAVDQMVSLGATRVRGYANLRAELEASMIPDVLDRGADPHTLRVEVTVDGPSPIYPGCSQVTTRVIGEAPGPALQPARKRLTPCC